VGKWSSEEQKSCSHHLTRQAPEIRLIALGYYRSLSLNDVSSKLDLDSFSISDKRSGPESADEESKHFPHQHQHLQLSDDCSPTPTLP